MLKIVLFDNQYYLIKDNKCYGPFHSIAEAESIRRNPPHSKLTELDNYTLIKNCD